MRGNAGKIKAPQTRDKGTIQAPESKDEKSVVKIPASPEKVNKALGEHLFALQEKENKGRGISCVRTIATYLQRNDFEGAQACAQNEWDKLSNYPDIKAFLKKKNVYDGDLNWP